MKKKIKDVIVKMVRKILKKTTPISKRIRFYRRSECIRLAISSKHNMLRDKTSEKTAIEFYEYLGKLSPEEKQKTISKLKENLDANSQEEVDRFISRQNHIYRHNLMDLKDLYTEEEYREQDQANEESKIYEKKLKKYKLKHYTVESLYGHNGLRWMSEEQRQKIQQGTFLDIGALDGDSALAFYHNYNAKKVYSFEPQEHNFKKLEYTADILGNEVIIPIKKAISNRIYNTHIIRKGPSSKLVDGDSGEEVEVTTIDDIVRERNIEKVDVIKFDIEGEEMNALKGGEETIKRNKPILVVSIYHNPQDFFEIKPYLEQLVPEYKYILRKTNPYSLIHELMLIAYV